MYETVVCQPLRQILFQFRIDIPVGNPKPAEQLRPLFRGQNLRQIDDFVSIKEKVRKVCRQAIALPEILPPPEIIA